MTANSDPKKSLQNLIDDVGDLTQYFYNETIAPIEQICLPKKPTENSRVAGRRRAGRPTGRSSRVT